ncbi:phytanoyl-CoA dioxygenase family protein [Leeia sp. TBRC 13508]|uniref:Phytanoyl-CoA dioxygenase family protein n=1 Tax=Leeia speluncae TaxID=2884804 RepID=A0ABS8D9W4_9NEIS|nr:phytanoyl-CoA dioxygenase family protein [Leeia speluncae]MCB6184922.1 phytanoyl-CoA dioxygenase family protein [Leeia speluncae]
MNTVTQFADSANLDFDAFQTICAQKTQLANYPFAKATQKNVLIYDGHQLRAQLTTQRRAILSELNYALSNGPGVIVIQAGFDQLAEVDKESAVFEKILEEESKHGVAADHFAKAGANGRIWNSFQKAAVLDPSAFIDYYANPMIDLVCEAWLGPWYQMTAQVNVVRPGGEAQQPHRDYHLGFQVVEDIAKFPVQLQVMSQLLTLQGAVAHTDMPIESGPTLLLPYSQQYALGYLAWRDERFKAYFQQHHVQLPLSKGDLIFFSPALFHAAGNNTTQHLHRMANLLQVSSAFGKPMETIDHQAMMKAVYPTLLEKVSNNALSESQLAIAIAMSADGYSFPNNLDKSPPVGGLAPQTGQQLLATALSEKWAEAEFFQKVDLHFLAKKA